MLMLTACLLAVRMGLTERIQDMKRTTILFSFAFMLTCLLTAAVAFARPAGSSAFLTDYAETPQQVVDQMEANRLIALRYARVFVLEPRDVLTHFRNELSLITLRDSIEVQVYHLDDSGRIVSEAKTLKSGIKVFADKNGRPILEYGTGNPLTSDLSGINQVKSKPLTEANNNAQPQNGAQPKPNPVAETQKTVAETLNPVPPPAPVSTIAPTTPGTTTLAGGTPPIGTPIEPTTAVAGAQMSTGGGSHIGGWLLPAGLAGAVVAMAGGSGGGSAPAGGSDPIIPPLPVVPEPTSLVALGAGLIGLGGLVSRRRKM